jgi:hypothetical protein
MWSRIKKAANAVAKAVNKAADAVADVVETVGNGINDGLTWLGEKIPDGGVLGWLGDVVSGFTTLVAGVVKGLGALIGGVLSGLIKIIGGIVTWNLDGVVEGLGDLASGIVGAVIAIVGAVVGLVQVIFTVGRPRRLNEEERRLVSLVFKESIATYNVRVVDGKAGLFSLNSRPFVLGNMIYMKDFTAAADPSTFVHECTHIWQNQHAGPRYAAEALYSQQWGAGYEWEKEAEKKGDWGEFQREAQGEFIQTVYESGDVAHGATGGGAFFGEDDEKLRVFQSPTTANDWTDLANAATKTIRGMTPWRLSGLG